MNCQRTLGVHGRKEVKSTHSKAYTLQTQANDFVYLFKSSCPVFLEKKKEKKRKIRTNCVKKPLVYLLFIGRKENFTEYLRIKLKKWLNYSKGNTGYHYINATVLLFFLFFIKYSSWYSTDASPRLLMSNLKLMSFAGQSSVCEGIPVINRTFH